MPSKRQSETLRSQDTFPIIYPLTAKLIQSAANKLGQIFPNQVFRACLLPGRTLDGHRKRVSTIICNMTIQKSHKMLRCPAKLQSVVAKFSGQIFTKIKFLILFSLRSFLLPLHSLFLKFPLNFQCRDKSSCTGGWFRNGLVISKTI